MKTPFGCLVLIAILLPAEKCVAAAAEIRPQWIWAKEDRHEEVAVCLQREFIAKVKIERAQLILFADFCQASVFINDQQVAVLPAYGNSIAIDVKDTITSDQNTLTINCHSVDGPSAVAALLELSYPGNERTFVGTDSKWQAVVLDSDSLSAPDSSSSEWRSTETFGPVIQRVGNATSQSIRIGILDDYTQWKQALNTDSATRPSTFQVPDGFEVRMIRSAAADEDSWVGLTYDERGRWIVAKEKKGLLRFTLNPETDRVMKTETINDTLAECRGLLVAHGSLYVMANNDKAFYRLRDTNGDDRFDETNRLTKFGGDVGHGRNQITLGPDGMIYAIFGDAVVELESAKNLVPKLVHPNHAEGTRSGFIARTDKEGRQWEIVTRGLRNPYGIDFNLDGEMFTYDADAEYDLGSSWYRPTRINHLMIGGDYGWRRVTRQWPPYFPDRPDMPRPTLDTGKGSPTAVSFGKGGKFPWPYREALFALDWAYGRILAIHLSPRGSSYAAQAETFLNGTPLNVTDVEFGPDGAMYFVTGGRGTQSALYRVSYAGPTSEQPKPTRQQLARHHHAEQSRQQRRRLESFFGTTQSSALEEAWPLLGSADPWIRGAARTVVEWQPVEQWRSRALSATNIDTALAGLLALVRVGELPDWAQVAARLNQFDLSKFVTQQRDEAIFLYEKCMEPGGILWAGLSDKIYKQLDSIYPSESFSVNRRLSVLLANISNSSKVPGQKPTPSPLPKGELAITDETRILQQSAKSPSFVERTIRLLQHAESSEERFHFLYVLRNTNAGWTPGFRETYFQYLKQTGEHIGGEGMPRFLRLIESESLATLAAKDRERYNQLLKTDVVELWKNEYGNQARQFVQQWTVNDFSDALNTLKPGRDIERGKRMFTVGSCIVCHRVGNRGGVTGPDLTSVSGRFAPRDLLTSIIEPSKVISEKYRNETLVLTNGQEFTGRIRNTDYRSDSVSVVSNSLASDNVTTVMKRDIESQWPSVVSPMPEGLLDTMSKEEVLDLLAWILAAGQPDASQQ